MKVYRIYKVDDPLILDIHFLNGIKAAANIYLCLGFMFGAFITSVVKLPFLL